MAPVQKGPSRISAPKALLGIFLILAAAAGAAGGVAVWLDGSPASMPEETLFSVGKGLSGSKIADDLEGRGLIRSALFFKFALRASGNVSKMKSGTYRISKGASSLGIMATLAEGKQATVRVTLPEGYTRRQIGELLESKSICSAADFMNATQDPEFLSSRGITFKTAEGYLFPDTYEFPLNADPEEIASTMVDGLFAAVKRQLPDAPKAESEDFAKGIILASIIEREYRVDSEAQIMASVFRNRLKIGMALQSCATVVYVITEIQGKPHPDVVYDRDLAIKSPYNTYLQRGLPPGPISNPGMTALSAVFHPAKTPYLYFRLVDPEKGIHHFSESLSEHNQAAGLYTKAVAGKR
jgi:UPF0755 protein